MQMRYGNVTVQMTSDYRTLKIRSELYMVNLKTIVSPFEISIYDHEMTVRCENERAIVQLLPNSSNIIINTNQYSKYINFQQINSKYSTRNTKFCISCFFFTLIASSCYNTTTFIEWLLIVEEKQLY